MLRIGIDIGGTFTDFAVWCDEADGYRQIDGQKIPTSRPQFARSVIEGLEAIFERQGVRKNDSVLVVHGTTVGTNAIIERSEPPIALITTQGYRDILNIARLRLDHSMDMFGRRPTPLVPRGMVFEVKERLRGDGSVEIPLDHESVIAAVAEAKKSGAIAIGVCLLHSYRNSVHEEQLLEIARAAFPELDIVASHEVWPQQSEYERAVLTLLNVYVKRLMAGYIGEVDGFLRRRLPNARLLVTKSNGGVMSGTEACRLPVHTLLSGPAAGVTAARTLAEWTRNEKILTMDMGGTSTDVSLVQVGRPTLTAQAEVGDFPLLLPVTAIEAMGAGGGSIIWLDGKVLKVGPRSAGSKPGPACYDMGGTAPTLTDAYLLCNYLSPLGLLGGRLPLSRALAEKAMEPIAEVGGGDVIIAAESCIEIATSNMLAKVLPFLARAGIGPADLTLMIFGGAGGIHGPLLAEEVGIKRILVPRLSSVFCAFGCLAADLVHDAVRSVTGMDLDADKMGRIFDELAKSGRAWVANQAAGGQVKQIDELYLAEMRYAAQSFTIPVDITEALRSHAGMAGFTAAFDAEHEKLFGYANPGAPVAINELLVRTFGRQAKPHAMTDAKASVKVAATSHRDLRFRGRWWPGCPIFSRSDLAAGWTQLGPTVIEHELATILVPPGFRAEVGALGDILLSKEN
ncbi:hydantoinase/oxoprolinase family protein [Bradyrhizobium sp. 4]|uniref:hydantoinase/oxoprolinase family protein n=1 Tax=unclassified Bradyrhizobium TaxID=2631580 RepID=UPI001FF7519B|nr:MULTISPECIES: hydantoinase/oxoprolinase family protein [unclassified Bradyrhizobium]MCK1402306.1 hydantoinase/oxoprolinase family protein [Bradyrhizobium sp. 39]MCK1632594.1 hydantoinase/oxoprolinase family protein [Bradyrhizobium sp. 162]MCK1750164.1 hydantoinase/oxoprolinase family protein [Bradyrhizobium sp. 135]UPJ36389.1 hydantoinase/oxoprolinase family protein [Bradyrhizobium sp. 4]